MANMMDVSDEDRGPLLSRVSIDIYMAAVVFVAFR
jgi:hypothetical protein